jgi:hypothetical protein
MSSLHKDEYTSPALAPTRGLALVEHVEHSGEHALGFFVLWESESEGDRTMLVRVIALGPEPSEGVRVGGVYITKPDRDQKIGSYRFMRTEYLEAEVEGYDHHHE